MKNTNIVLASGGTLILILVYSGFIAHDRATWIMEVAPVMIALPVLAATYRRFPLTSLLYSFVFVHAFILIVGGTYTYAHVPLGFWIQDLFALHRNPYDKIGHLAQGFVPALVAREILIRRGYLTSWKMAGFLATCVAMAISAWYELIEWWAALALGQGADEFLGTQGDPWDTQSDMFFAFIGASIAVLLLSRVHHAQINKIKALPDSPHKAGRANGRLA